MIVGAFGLWVNQVEERKFQRIRFDGLRRLVEVGQTARSLDSFRSIGVDRILGSPRSAPKTKVQRAVLALRLDGADSGESLPLIQGHLLSEPRMESAAGRIAALTGLPVLHQRSVDPRHLRSLVILAFLVCIPLVAAIVSEVLLLKQHLDRRSLKERAVFSQALVLADQPANGPNGRGPFRTLKIQVDGRVASVLTRRWEPFGPGETVTVFYDPARPNQVEMDDSRHSFPPQALLLTGPLAAAAFGVFLLTRAIRMIRIAKRA